MSKQKKNEQRKRQEQYDEEDDNIFNPLSFHDEIHSEIHVVDGHQRKRLSNKLVKIYHVARGMKFLRIDKNIYPLRTFTDAPIYFTEKKYPSKAIWFLPIAVLAWWFQTIYMLYLQTDKNYFNAVTFITSLAFAAVLFLYTKKLTREVVNHIYLKKNQLLWDKTSFETTPLKQQRTIEIHRGFNGITVISVFALALIISTVFTSLTFEEGQLPLLEHSYAVNGWVQLNDYYANKIVADFAQTMMKINSVLNIVYIVGSIIIVLNLFSIGVNLARSRSGGGGGKTKQGYSVMSEALTYDKETKELYYLDPYLNPFENAQLDINTLDAKVLQIIAEEKTAVKLTGEKEKLAEPTMQDQPMVRQLKISELRGLLDKEFSKLAIKDGKEVKPEEIYAEKRIIDILVEGNYQKRFLTENMNVVLDHVDQLEAALIGKTKSYDEAVRRLEDSELDNEALSDFETKKQMTSLSKILLTFAGLLLAIIIVLIVLLYNSGGVPV